MAAAKSLPLEATTGMDDALPTVGMTQWNATQMRAAVEYLESRRDAGPRADRR